MMKKYNSRLVVICTLLSMIMFFSIGVWQMFVGVDGIIVNGFSSGSAWHLFAAFIAALLSIASIFIGEIIYYLVED